MKNTQKILLAVLALVLAGIIAAIIFVRTNDNSNNVSDNSTSDNYTLPGEFAPGETITDGKHNHNHEHLTESSTKNSTDSNNNITVNNGTSDSPVSNNKVYDLKDAEVLNTQKSSFGNVRLLSAKSDGKKVFLLEAEYKSKKFYVEYPAYYNIENIYYANVDGTYGDEIIIHSSTNIDGDYVNDVLKITPDGIIHLLTANNAFYVATSFNTNLKDNFNVEFSNKYVSFKTTVYVKGINDENYEDSYWETNGKLAVIETEDEVWIDETFRGFEPRDVDDDGIYEIVCLQHTSLGDYTSCIGNTSVTLKYNTQLNQFEVVSADFYPYSK